MPTTCTVCARVTQRKPVNALENVTCTAHVTWPSYPATRVQCLCLARYTPSACIHAMPLDLIHDGFPGPVTEVVAYVVEEDSAVGS